MSEEDSQIEEDNQNRINNAHQRLKQGIEIRLSDPNDQSHKLGDQDRALQDYEEIELNLKEGPTPRPDPNQNPYENYGPDSSKAKSEHKSHYNQFYHGDEMAQFKQPTAGKRGTFLGVFIPCLQNILSVVIFLRLSPIVGEAGIFHTLILLVTSMSTTLMTILSMSAIATNGKIRSGGLYYLASRSLGPASGGTIGLLYYFATAFSAGMSIIGSVEAIVVSTNIHFGPPAFSYRFFSLIILGIMIVLKLLGSNYMNRVSLTMIVFVFISIFSTIIGLFTAGKRADKIQESLPGITGLSGSNFVNNWNPSYMTSSMAQLFALFFNAATGILTATNLSDNLQDPIRSIPKGTIWAHISSTSLYLIMIFLFGSVGLREALMEKEVVVAAAVAWPASWIVYIGVILSSNGAALNNFSNAPALLKALVEDDLLPKPFDFLKGDIRKSVFFTSCLLLFAFAFGDLDAVAPLVTIFYLLCYGGVNITCFLQDWLGSPNWRPKWKYYHKATAFIGVVLCVACMIIISWWASLSCICGALVVYAYFDKKSQEKNWGDGSEGLKAERARNALLKLDKRKKHVKNWRPHYLALGYINEKGKISAPGIFKLLHQLRKGTGLAIYGCVIKGDYTQEGYEEAGQKERDLDEFMKKNKYNVFSKVVVSPNIENGMVFLMQASGLGGLEPNTVLLSWPNQWEDDELKSRRFVNLIKHAFTVGHLLTIVKPQKNFDNDTKHQGNMDIWSFNFEKGMLLLLAYILQKNTHWKRCTVRLFIVTSLPLSESETMKRVAREYLDRYRLFSVDIFIEIVHVDLEIIQQFTQHLQDTIEQKEKQYNEVIKQGNKDFEYGTLPSLMKLKALQEKENKAIFEFKKKSSINFDQDDLEEVSKRGRKLNKIILSRSSNETSLVITNLPPLSKDQSPFQYLTFCQKMTEGLERVLFVQNPSKEVLTQYS